MFPKKKKINNSELYFLHMYKSIKVLNPIHLYISSCSLLSVQFCKLLLLLLFSTCHAPIFHWICPHTSPCKLRVLPQLLFFYMILIFLLLRSLFLLLFIYIYSSSLSLSLSLFLSSSFHKQLNLVGFVFLWRAHDAITLTFYVHVIFVMGALMLLLSFSWWADSEPRYSKPIECWGIVLLSVSIIILWVKLKHTWSITKKKLNFVYRFVNCHICRNVSSWCLPLCIGMLDENSPDTSITIHEFLH